MEQNDQNGRGGEKKCSLTASLSPALFFTNKFGSLKDRAHFSC